MYQVNAEYDSDDSDESTERQVIFLGSVHSLIKRASTCGFCALVVDAATRLARHWRLAKEEQDNDKDEETDDDEDEETDDDEDDDEDEETDDDEDEETDGGEDGEPGDGGDEEPDDGKYKEQSSALTIAEEELEDDESKEPGDDKNEESDDDASPNILPTLADSSSIKCSLEPHFFCTLYNVLYDGKVRKSLRVHRLQVEFCPWPGPSFVQINLQACWDDKDGGFVKGSGREFSSLVDTDRVRGWLQQCESHHGDRCGEPEWLSSSEAPEFLKVIDVDKRCIVDAPPNCRYLALSYVWGKPPPEQDAQLCRSTTTANIGQLRKEGGMSPASLPRTIRDAMTLTASLGERYLWVDAFCITQDDVQEVVKLTAKMDLVYACALMTIIAAAGEHGDAGLPGVTEGSREVIQGRVKITENLSVMQTAMQGIGRNLKDSKWNSRGWTFQERLLSRRVLMFTEDQIFWNCETSTWGEETILEPEEPECWVLASNLECNSDSGYENETKFTLDALSSYIRHYSSRALTYQSDFLPAFLAVVRRVEYRTSENFHWGLTCTRFDQSLAWYGGDGRRTERYRIALDGGIIHQVPYPSWSWLGWIGGIIGIPYYHEELYKDTLSGKSRSELDIYMLMSDGSVREITGMSTPPTDSDAQSGDQGPTLDPPNDSPVKQWKGATKVEGPITINFTKSNSLVMKSVNLSLSGSRNGSESTESSRAVHLPVHDTGCLVFWTSHAKLLTWRTSNGYRLSVLIDNDVLRIRAFLSGLNEDDDLPESDENVSDSNDTKYIRNAGKRAVWKSARWIDYIVISRRYTRTDRLNLLMVEWTDAERNVARRIGTAIIPEEDWVRQEREWKLVILK
jgi:hypothetical protein